jgi:hypothetical protein
MSGLEVMLLGALTADPQAVPVLAGAGGNGRTRALLALRDRLGPSNAQYVDLERVATTPEQFLRTLIAHSPFATPDGQLPARPATPRVAFDEALKFLAGARTRDGQPATFLLDEVLELRTFESFPGLRTLLADFIATVQRSENRFVLSTRFAHRARRLFSGEASRLRVHAVEPLPPDAIQAALVGEYRGVTAGIDAADLAATVHALTQGRPLYVHAVLNALKAMSSEGACDPISALAAVLMPGTRLDAECRFAYEFRLHRARGYGALKGILACLAEQEPQTLTEVARRLQRTPGSTKDYLGWLEDVDLLRCDRKRYRFADPLLRVWVRLNGDPTPCTEEDVAREVHRYAMERLPRSPAAPPAPVSRPAMRPGREAEMEID